MTEPIRFALFGAGYMGQIHAHALSNLPEAELRWVVGRSIERAQHLADSVDAQATTDIKAVLNDATVDAIVIAYPTFLHRELAIKALAADKYVLCEKPIALTMEDADAMIDAASRAALTAGYTDAHTKQLAARRLMVGHVIRFWPEYAKILQLAGSGELGQVQTAELKRLSTAPGWADWFQDFALSGGMIADLMVHDFDIAAALLGDPATVTAYGVRATNGIWQHARAVIADRNGRHTLVTGSHLMPATYPFTSSIRVVGDEATVEYSFVADGSGVEDTGQTRPGSLKLYRANGRGENEGTSGELIHVPAGDAFQHQLQYFIDCIRKDIPFAAGTPGQARTALAIALATHESVEGDYKVSVRP